ncbi:MAG: hypothetical protein R2716_12740 [Microthrixaceae bacterium]
MFEPHPYRAFAMPVKLFEAIGHGLPCLADSDTAAGDFVRRTAFGWPVEPGQLPEVLEHLSGDRGSVEATHDRVARGAAPQHTPGPGGRPRSPHSCRKSTPAGEAAPG